MSDITPNTQHVIIDLREPFEYDSGHVVGAINITPEALRHGTYALRTIPKDSSIILYCTDGSKSKSVMHTLKGMGFQNIANGINKENVESKLGI